jgi:hypothetical protein
MKPKPFSALKNFTVPVVKIFSLHSRTGPCGRSHSKEA